MNTTWTDYYKNTKNRNPRPLLVEAVNYVSKKDFALDLGCGAGDETFFLQEVGFSVTSVDSSPEVKKYIPDAIISNFADFSFPVDKYDIVSAQYALPFNPPESFSEVFSKITRSLKSGGIFTGQFFGDCDEWISNKNMSFYSKEDVLEFLKPYNIHIFREKKEDDKLASGGIKFWHVFSVIAEKK